MASRGFLDFLAPYLGASHPAAAKPGAPKTGRAQHNALDGALLTVPGAAGPIEVLVRVRPNARRLILKIDRKTGSAALTLPRGIGRVRAERFLDAHLSWLNARLSALPARIEFRDGIEIPFRGVPHRIVHSLPFRGETRAGEAQILVHGDAAQVSRRTLRFLKAEALKALSEASLRHAARLNVSLGKITIKDTRSRWGSCSSRGDLSYSWRLILAPPFVLDYLAAHEVAHRLEMNHSPRYWRHVETLLPEFESAEAWLKRHGPSLHHFGEA